MRKVILHFAITLDGIVSNVDQWGTINDEILADSFAILEKPDAVLFGRNSYQPLVEYWQKAEVASESASERIFAKKLNQIHKYVLSHGAVDLTWQNSDLIRVNNNEGFKKEITQLKNASGREIWVDAGEGIWRSFLETDLWDGLDMLVHPVILGNGKPLFNRNSSKIPLKLVHSKSYSNGVVNLHYKRE